MSADTVSTFETFATANEGDLSPTDRSARNSILDWPIRPLDQNGVPTSRSKSAPNSRPASRPGTAFKRPPPEPRRDSGSERADSGVGIPRRSNSSHDTKRPGGGTPSLSKSPTPNTKVSSPPMSPQANFLHDPATTAVNALLDPISRPLGLKDKALLFGLVESLRQVCRTLQTEDEGQYESRVLRRRLDDARRALAGTLEQRPASHG